MQLECGATSNCVEFESIAAAAYCPPESYHESSPIGALPPPRPSAKLAGRSGTRASHLSVASPTFTLCTYIPVA
jgi:hypothetical protein